MAIWPLYEAYKLSICLQAFLFSPVMSFADPELSSPMKMPHPSFRRSYLHRCHPTTILMYFDVATPEKPSPPTPKGPVLCAALHAGQWLSGFLTAVYLTFLCRKYSPLSRCVSCYALTSRCSGAQVGFPFTLSQPIDPRDSTLSPEERQDVYWRKRASSCYRCETLPLYMCLY